LILLTKLSSVIYLRLVSDASGMLHSLTSFEEDENTLYPIKIPNKIRNIIDTIETLDLKTLIISPPHKYVSI